MSDTLASALVAALTDLSVIEKGRKANVGSYSYEYADIADVVKLTRPKLAEHGIVALTPVHDHGNGLACTVTLVHTSGETMDLGPFPFPAGRDAQATGSMVTYHRRYALVAALGLAAGDDDDGHAATQSARQPEPLPAGESVTAAKKRITAAGYAADTAKAIWEQADLPITTVEISGNEVRWVTPDAIAVLEGVIADYLDAEGQHDGGSA